jgi:hypothetical protein
MHVCKDCFLPFFPCFSLSFVSSFYSDIPMHTMISLSSTWAPVTFVQYKDVARTDVKTDRRKF